MHVEICVSLSDTLGKVKNWRTGHWLPPAGVEESSVLNDSADSLTLLQQDYRQFLNLICAFTQLIKFTRVGACPCLHRARWCLDVVACCVVAIENL